jgi:hypothetical protein
LFHDLTPCRHFWFDRRAQVAPQHAALAHSPGAKPR